MFLKFSQHKTFTLEELAYFIPVTNANLTNDCVSFPVTGKKETYSSILITLQDYQAQMSTVKIDAGADFVHSLYISSDLNLQSHTWTFCFRDSSRLPKDTGKAMGAKETNT